MLLTRTIVLLIIGSALASLLGLLTALFFFRIRKGRIKNEVVYAFLFVIIPGFIYIQSWIFFGDYLYQLLNQFLGTTLDFNGPVAWLTVYSFSNLPLTVGFAMLGLSLVPDWLADMCEMEGGDLYIFNKVYLRFMMPFLTTGFLLSFVIGLYDFSIASVFGMNTFGLRLLSRYSAGTGLWEMFLVCLPALVLTVLIILLILPFFKNIFNAVNTAKTNPFKDSTAIKFLSVIGGIILLFFMAVPFFSLLWKAMEATDILGIINNALPEFVTSFVMASIAAFFITLFGLVVNVLLRQRKRYILIALSLILFTMPAALLALVSIRIMNRPVLGIIYDSMAMPIFVLFLRYQFIGVIGEGIALNSLDDELFDVADLEEVGNLQKLKLFGGALKRETAAIFLLSFVFCAGDTTVPILVAPGGIQTISVKIYNYLHYGASDVIAVLCLFFLLICVLMIVVAQHLLKRRDAHG